MVKYSYKLYLAALIAFFVIDIAWLALLSRTLYRNNLGFLLTPTTYWIATLLLYLLFIQGSLVFVVVPGLQDTSLKPTLLRAA